MTATKPKSRVTVRSDIELGSHGSKWKHGWIPLNEVAAAIKAKKFGKGGGGGGSKVVGKSRIDTERQAAHAIAKAGKARPPRSAPKPHGGSTIVARGHDGKPVVIAQQRHVEAGVSLPGPKSKLPEGRKVTAHDVHGDKGEIRDAENGRILSTGHTSKRSAAVIANRHNAEVEAGKVTLTGNERYNLTTGERLPDAAPVTASVKVDHEAVHTDADLKRQHLYAYMNRQQAHLDRTEAELKKRGYVKVGDSKWRKGGNETKAREIAALAEKTTAPKVGESVKAKKGDYAVISGHVTSTDASYKRTHTPKFTVAKVAKVDADGRATHFTRPGSSRVMATHEFTSMSAPDRPKVSVVSQDKVNTDTLHEAVAKHAGSGTFPSMDEARSFVAEHLGGTPKRRVQIPKGISVEKNLTPDGRTITGQGFKAVHTPSGKVAATAKTKADLENLLTHMHDNGADDLSGSAEEAVAKLNALPGHVKDHMRNARYRMAIPPAREATVTPPKEPKPFRSSSGTQRMTADERKAFPKSQREATQQGEPALGTVQDRLATIVERLGGRRSTTAPKPNAADDAFNRLAEEIAKRKKK